MKVVKSDQRSRGSLALERVVSPISLLGVMAASPAPDLVEQKNLILS